MKLAAVARILNEDDIAEAFVRHTLAFVDSLMVMDNGSTDRTLEILGALRAEGLNLTVLQARSVFFHEEGHNTFLYHTAALAHRPDWVLCLDADEFIDARSATPRDRLAAVTPDVAMVTLPLVNYHADGLADPDLLVPRRMTLRDAARPDVWKIALRGDLGTEVAVAAGNHGASRGAEPLSFMHLPDLPLAHYPARHPLQLLAKAACVRLKVLAGGGGTERVARMASHCDIYLQQLTSNPAALLRNAGFMDAAPPPVPLVEDPIGYAGGPLRYTQPADPAMKAIQSVMLLASQIAASHGSLLDAHPDARAALTAEMRPRLLAR